MKYVRARSVFVTLLIAVLFIGCTTSAQFLLPRNTDIILKDERFAAVLDGYADVTVRPFFWTGIHYQLVQGNNVVREGKLDSSFRIASLFWPPYAIIYWPKGFSNDCYDMTKTTPGDENHTVTCPTIQLQQKKKDPAEERMPWQGQ